MKLALPALLCLLILQTQDRQRIAEAASSARGSEMTVWGGIVQSVERPSPRKDHTAARKSSSRKSTPRAAVAPFPRVRPLLPVVDHEDIRLEHKLLADEVIRMLPPSCRSQIKNFYVRYDHPKQRGLAGKSSVIVSGNVPLSEFRALLVHEIFGHVIDLGCLVGTQESGPSGFRDGNEILFADDPSIDFYRISWITERVQRGGVHPEDFVSGYASWDAFEDFAESVAYYLLQPEAFRARAEENAALRAKLAWIESSLFSKGVPIARGQSTWNGSDVPWDVTKLAYIWLGSQHAVAQVP